MASGIYLNTEYLKELFNAGTSIDEIALMCDVTRFTVRRNLIQLGLIEKQETNHRISNDEMSCIKRMYNDGYSVYDIAKVISRTHAGILKYYDRDKDSKLHKSIVTSDNLDEVRLKYLGHITKPIKYKNRAEAEEHGLFKRHQSGTLLSITL